MCVTWTGEIEKFEKDTIVFKVVTLYNQSCYWSEERIAQNSSFKGIVMVYNEGEKVVSSFENTPGIYCFQKYEDAEFFINYQRLGASQKIIEIKCKKGSQYRKGLIFYLSPEESKTINVEEGIVGKTMKTIKVEHFLP